MIKFNKKWDDKIKARFNGLKAVVLPAMKGKLKADAKLYIDTFQKGVKTNSLNLKALNPATVMMKQKDGMQKAQIPLYGEGLKNPKSYINGLRIVEKGKFEYKVLPSKGKHHSGIDMKHLFKIHERGCKIRVTQKMRWFLGLAKGFWLKNDTKIVEIPPRPAMAKAYQNTRRIIKEDAKERKKYLKSAVRQYVVEGKAARLNAWASLSKQWPEWTENG